MIFVCCYLGPILSSPEIIKVESTNQTFEYWHAWDFHSFDVTRQNDKLKGGHWLLATTRLGPQTGERSSPTSSVHMGQSLVEWNHIPSTWIIGSLHPGSLTWNLKMMVSIRNLLFQGLIFRFHVKFRGSIGSFSWRPTGFMVQVDDRWVIIGSSWVIIGLIGINVSFSWRVPNSYSLLEMGLLCLLCHVFHNEVLITQLFSASKIGLRDPRRTCSTWWQLEIGPLAFQKPLFDKKTYKPMPMRSTG